MRALTLIVGLFAALVVGALALLLYGEAAGGAAAIGVLLLAGFGAFFAGAALRRLVLLAALLATVGGLGFGGWQAYRVSASLLDTSGPVDAADPQALSAADAKLDGVREQSGFRLELTEQELTAVVQDGLQQADAPVRRVTLDFVARGAGETGELRFRADFKNGSLAAEGTLGYRLVDGGIEPRVESVSLGALRVPRAVRSALEDLVERVAELNATLAEQRVTVQSLEIDDERMVLIGTQAGGQVLTSQLVLTGLKQRAASLGSAQGAPPERVGPGTVDGREAPGSRWYIALGDSLAANVGVASAREGYVSRVHAALSKRDGAQYGLRNFGVSGESSGSILRAQLTEATAFMRGADIAYVSIDIGANDLLPHLGSADCEAGAGSAPCKARLDASLAAYRGNLDTLFARVRSAAPQARLLFLQTYNPFSFGFQGLAFEDDTNRVTQELNAIAAEVAGRHGVLVADGFAPLRGRAAAATHMTDSPPDIHPRAAGYDALAAALLQAK
jgi:lysophospholipase L1-like esterase